MSTQRRAHRTTPTTNSQRELRFRRNPEHLGGAEMRELLSALYAHLAHVRSGGGTASIMSILWLAWERLFWSDETSHEAARRVATESLLPDHRSETLAGLGLRRNTTPPCGVRGPSESIPRVIPRSSLQHIPNRPARTRLHTTLPHAPVGKVRWAERHDGKRDLYFQHAA